MRDVVKEWIGLVEFDNIHLYKGDEYLLDIILERHASWEHLGYDPHMVSIHCLIEALFV